MMSVLLLCAVGSEQDRNHSYVVTFPLHPADMSWEEKSPTDPLSVHVLLGVPGNTNLVLQLGVSLLDGGLALLLSGGSLYVLIVLSGSLGDSALAGGLRGTLGLDVGGSSRNVVDTDVELGQVGQLELVELLAVRLWNVSWGVLGRCGR